MLLKFFRLLRDNHLLRAERVRPDKDSLKHFYCQLYLHIAPFFKRELAIEMFHCCEFDLAV